MHIARVAIENFRNFSSIDIDGLGSSVVLVGENASGKSNFLHALRLVLDPSLPETARQLVAEDFWDGLEESFLGWEIKVEVDLVDFDDDDNAKAVLGEFLVERSPHRARLTYLYRPRDGVEAGEASKESDYESLVFGGLDEARRIGRAEWRYISLRVLPALRDAESDLASPRSPLRRLVARAEVSPVLLEKVATGIDKATGALLAAKPLSDLEDAVAERLGDLVGDLFAVDATLGVVSTRPEQLLRSLRLFIDSERRRGVGHASLGTANLLYLTLLLEDIAAQRQAGELVELILAVEEPEAHLHPHVQRVLFRHLLREDRALVVTTHSPYVVSVAPLASLVLLRDEDGETQAFDGRSIGLTDRQERDVERYLDVTRAEMLFARFVLLVEGISELYLIPAFAMAVGLDLDAAGVTVCSVHGTDFLPYVRLLGPDGLNIPFAVVTDGDEDDSGVPVGLGRSSELLEPETAEALEEALNDEDYAEARRLCAEDGILVGHRTLELDLLPAATDAMCEAFSELDGGALSRKRFTQAVRAAPNDLDASAKVLRKIKAVGKGRFSQRLAEHLADVDPPAHIAGALRRVSEFVDGEEEEGEDDSE